MTSSECPPAHRLTPPPWPSPAAREADDAAWVRAHQAPLWRHLRGLGADPAEAEEVLQDTLLAGLDHPDRTSWSHAGTTRWLRAVGRNLFYQRIRRRRRRWNRERPDSEGLPRVAAPPSPGEGEGDGDDRAAQLAERLRKCIGQLGPRARRVLELRYGQGLGRDAIGRDIGLRRQGVKSLLQRIRAKLRACLDRRPLETFEP